MVVDELIEIARSGAQGRKLKDIRAGLGYTCVMLEDGSCGLAYTFRNQLGCRCGIINDAGKLIGRGVDETVLWARDGNLLKSAIGIASINAVINRAQEDWEIGNVTSAIEIGPDDALGMVGEFRPILNKVKDKTRANYVFELGAAEGSGLYPSESIPQYLPKCSVIVLTATSIINHTFDQIIPYCSNAREVCIVGPSTTLCPEVFRRYPITMLAGSVVREPEQVLQIVSQGGGTMSMKPAVKQVLVQV